MATIRKGMAFPLAALSMALAAGAAAQTKIGEIVVISVEGTCGDLAVVGRRLGGECSGKLLNFTYPDGRVGLYFGLKSGAIVTFSGMDGDNPTPDSDVIHLDKVIMSRSDTPDTPDVYAATGTCRFGNPYKGPATIACEGRLTDGRPFTAAFTTNGKPPT